MKAYSMEHELIVDYPDIKTSLEFIKTDNKYLFLRRFHAFLQESRSHYGSSHEGAERLILKYYKYFVMLKNFEKDEYGIDILENIDKFPVDTDIFIKYTSGSRKLKKKHCYTKCRIFHCERFYFKILERC